MALGVIAPLLLNVGTASAHAQSTLDKLKPVVDALQIRDIGGYTYTARGFTGSGIAKVEQSGRDVRILATWLPVGGGPTMRCEASSRAGSCCLRSIRCP